MSPSNRLAALAAAALSAVLLVLLLRDAGRGARPAPPAAAAPVTPPVAAPVPPPIAAPRKPRRRKAAVKQKTAAEEERDAEILRKKLRGSRLREKGEALGGDGVQHRVNAVEKRDEKSDR